MIINTDEQGSDGWFGSRAGIPTGSEFSRLITSTGAPSKSMPEYAAQLAADAYAGKALDRFGGNQYTDRGTGMEEEARLWYELQYNCEVEQVGFISDGDPEMENPIIRYGASPDGLVGEHGMVEFKCQIAKCHVATLLYFKKHGRCPSSYVAQTQGELLVAEREWNDLVFYHPALPKLVIRQVPDPKIVAGLKSQLAACIATRNITLSTLRSF